MKVLLAEDDKNLGRLLQNLLKKREYQNRLGRRRKSGLRTMLSRWL